MWDHDRQFDGIDAGYCWKYCATRCEDCPAPRLLPESQPGVVAYQLITTQWQYTGMGIRVGINYEAALPVIAAHLARWQQEERQRGQEGAWCGLGVTDLLADVQIIEAAILAAEDELREVERQRAEADRHHKNLGQAT